jgi:hypothetical protein
MVQSARFLVTGLAMTIKAKAGTAQAALKRRIRQFYKLLNQGEFERCHQMIDPQVRLRPNSVTLLQYENSVRDFLAEVGSVNIREIDLNLHLRERSALYGDRDFAVGKLAWEDKSGKRHVFLERWVLDNRAWYTRCTGFISPYVVPPNAAKGRAKTAIATSRKRQA